MFASYAGDEDIVKLLIERGARLDLQDRNGKTALILAAYKGRSYIVRRLIYHGAPLDITDNMGYTALYAADKVCLGVVGILIEEGA